MRSVIDVHKLAAEIEGVLDVEENKLKRERIQQENELVMKRRTLNQEMEIVQEQVDKFKDVEVTKQNGVENTKILADLQEHLDGLIADQQEIEQREKILGFIVTQFPRLEAIGNNLRPY